MLSHDEIVVGVSVNNVSGITGKQYSIHDLLRAIREAEAMGFGAVWIHDGMFGRRTTAAYDPSAVYAAAAAQTKKIRLCTGILIPQIRNPIHMAQQWATVWEISEGRAIMCAATGAGKDVIAERQYGALAAVRSGAGAPVDGGYLFKNRTALFGECLDVMKRLWTEDKFSHKGKFFEFNNITLGLARPKIAPTMLVAAGIYIPKAGVGAHHYTWNPEVAGTFMMGPAITNITARYGDGWMTVHVTPDEFDKKWEEIQNLAQGFGNKPTIRGINFFTHVDNDSKKAFDAVREHLKEFHGPPPGQETTSLDLTARWAAAGSGKEIAEKLNAYIERGVSLFQLVVASPDQMGMMKKIADEVLPHLRTSKRP